MARRVWVAEGVASDGGIYGRALQLRSRDPVSGRLEARPAHASVLKNHLGDIPSCPCLDALVGDAAGAEARAEDADA